MPRIRRRGKSVRKAREGQPVEQDGDQPKVIPRCLVVHRGRVGRLLRQLERDIRAVMQPNTAMQLKVLRRNNLRDFIVNGVPLGVSHLLVLTMAASGPMARFIRLPHGPTLTFRVEHYTLTRDVVNGQRRPFVFQKQLEQSPLVVMSGFENAPCYEQLVQTFIQNMFPSINVDTVSLSRVRRCLLVNRGDNETIELRHFAIRSVPAGLSRSAKKLVRNRVPNLGRYTDISQFFLDPGQLSESEPEPDQSEILDLSQDLSSRGCKTGQKSNIRLVELGPRISLRLVKIEEEIDHGYLLVLLYDSLFSSVLYHSYIHKTPSELAIQQQKRRNRQRLDNEHRVIRRLEANQQRRERMAEKQSEDSERINEMQNAVTGEQTEKRRRGEEEKN